MIKLILKRIWIQRKSNVWIVLNCAIISWLLFLASDIGVKLFDEWRAPIGLNVNQEETYVVTIGEQENRMKELTEDEQAILRTESVRQIRRLLEENTAVEVVSIFGNMDQNVLQVLDDKDKVVYGNSSYGNYVDYNFLEQYAPEVIYGNQLFESEAFKEAWQQQNNEDPIILSKDIAKALFCRKPAVEGRNVEYYEEYSYDSIVGRNVQIGPGPKRNRVSVIVDQFAFTRFEMSEWGFIKPFRNTDLAECVPYFVLKVKEGATLNLEPFNIGPYYFESVMPYGEWIDYKFETEAGVYNITVVIMLFFSFFMFYLIFGILGSFWQRTSRRTQDIALQMSLGATPRKILWEILLEAVLLLVIAYLPILIILANQYYFSVLTISMGMVGDEFVTIKSFLTLTLINFSVMAIMVIIGVIPPAVKAMRIKPAEALMSE